MITYFILLQVIIIFCAVLGYGIIQDGISAFSALLGGLLAIIPNLVFLPWFHHSKKSDNAQKTLKAFYLAEGCKIFLSLLLFTIVFQWTGLRALPLFATFIAVQMAYWVFSYRKS